MLYNNSTLEQFHNYLIYSGLWELDYSMYFDF